MFARLFPIRFISVKRFIALLFPCAGKGFSHFIELTRLGGTYQQLACTSVWRIRRPV